MDGATHIGYNNLHTLSLHTPEGNITEAEKRYMRERDMKEGQIGSQGAKDQFVMLYYGFATARGCPLSFN